jgi:hypothetical protein
MMMMLNLSVSEEELQWVMKEKAQINVHRQEIYMRQNKICERMQHVR